MNTFEAEAKLPPNLRHDINQFCRMRGYSYASILNAPRDDIWEMGKVHALICHLGNKSHSLNQIAKATGLGSTYVLSVLEKNREKDFKIRTQNYEARA